MAVDNSGHRRRDGPSDARQAIRFMLVKAAIFIVIPLAAAALAVVLTLK